MQDIELKKKTVHSLSIILHSLNIITYMLYFEYFTSHVVIHILFIFILSNFL